MAILMEVHMKDTHLHVFLFGFMVGMAVMGLLVYAINPSFRFFI